MLSLFGTCILLLAAVQLSTSASIGSAKSQLDEITNEQLKQLFMEAVLETDIEAERDYILSFFENLDDDKMGKLKNYIETAVFNKPLEDVLEFLDNGNSKEIEKELDNLADKLVELGFPSDLD